MAASLKRRGGPGSPSSLRRREESEVLRSRPGPAIMRTGGSRSSEGSLRVVGEKCTYL